MVVEAFEIREDIYDTMVFDSPKNSYRPRIMTSYILSEKEPIPGEELDSLFLIPYFPKFPDIISNEKVKIPRDADVKKIPFEVFKDMFESCGGTVEEIKV
jgi:hypothetical protein